MRRRVILFLLLLITMLGADLAYLQWQRARAHAQAPVLQQTIRDRTWVQQHRLFLESILAPTPTVQVVIDSLATSLATPPQSSDPRLLQLHQDLTQFLNQTTAARTIDRQSVTTLVEKLSALEKSLVIPR